MLINPFQQKLTIEQEMQLLKRDIATLAGFTANILISVIELNGYENIQEDFKEIEKVMKENDIKVFNINSIPECLNVFEKSQLLLFSLNLILNFLTANNSGTDSAGGKLELIKAN